MLTPWFALGAGWVCNHLSGPATFSVATISDVTAHRCRQDRRPTLTTTLAYRFTGNNLQQIPSSKQSGNPLKRLARTKFEPKQSLDHTL